MVFRVLFMVSPAGAVIQSYRPSPIAFPRSSRRVRKTCDQTGQQGGAPAQRVDLDMLMHRVRTVANGSEAV